MMPRLIDDIVVRRIVQGAVLAVIAGLVVLQVFFVIVVWAHRSGLLESWDLKASASLLFGVLVFPFEKSFASFTAVFVGLVPIVFSAVCFQYDALASPPTSVDRLNITGRICVIFLVTGVGIGFINIIVSELATTAINDLANGDSGRTSIKNLFSSILSFQSFYFLHLLGIKK